MTAVWNDLKVTDLVFAFCFCFFEIREYFSAFRDCKSVPAICVKAIEGGKKKKKKKKRES